MSVAKKILPVINGIAGYPIDMNEVLYCSMLQANGTVYMDDGTTIDDIDDAMSKGKLVICRFIPGGLNAEPVTLIGVNNVFPVCLRGTCKIGNNIQIVAAYGQENNNTDVWTVETTTVAPQVNADWNATGGAAQILNKPTIPSIDSELSETSTNPVQNKAINVLTRQLWNRIDVVSRIGVEYASANNYIASSGTYVGQWRPSTTYKHWIVPVDGIRAVAVQAGTSDSYPTFLRNYESTTGSPDYAAGYTGVTRVAATQTKIFTVPGDAKYMYLNTGQNDTAKPAHVYMSGVTSNQPKLEYIRLSAGATACNITLTDTKQSFVIDNSENSDNVPIHITNLCDYVYSNEYITAGKGIVTQFDFESIEVEQKTYLFVKQTVLYDRTPS